MQQGQAACHICGAWYLLKFDLTWSNPVNADTISDHAAMRIDRPLVTPQSVAEIANSGSADLCPDGWDRDRAIMAVLGDSELEASYGINLGGQVVALSACRPTSTVPSRSVSLSALGRNFGHASVRGSRCRRRTHPQRQP